MAKLKSICLRLGIPPPLWVTNSPTRIYEYQVLKDGVDLKDKTVLDFGCGEGLFAIDLAAKSKHVIAVDMNKTAIERAQRFARCSWHKNHLDFRAGRIEEINLPDELVDDIFCACVLQLVDNLPATLTALRRILKPGGEIHATVDSFAYLQDEGLKKSYKRTHHIIEYFTETTITAYLKNAGFSTVTVTPILKGRTAKDHFARYFQNSGITYNILERLSMVRKIMEEDKKLSADMLGAELLVRVKKSV